MKTQMLKTIRKNYGKEYVDSTSLKMINEKLNTKQIRFEFSGSNLGEIYISIDDNGLVLVVICDSYLKVGDLISWLLNDLEMDETISIHNKQNLTKIKNKKIRDFVKNQM